ncbi:MAG: hypothetical protein IKT53_09120 [Bacteroidaceae bacterium]|nr:hypothetical protein [Bacteroidales bacterium]MBR4295133.1 hypothetical protein [Bacteroidaceae bacterium]
MKKLALLFILALTLTTARADDSTIWFTSSQFALQIDGEWTDWVKIDVRIKVTEDKVTIYSDEVQIYKIKEKLEAPYDDTGKQIKYKVVDQDGDYGTIRFRKQNDGTLQLYIDFSNIRWVYSSLEG